MQPAPPPANMLASMQPLPPPPNIWLPSMDKLWMTLRLYSPADEQSYVLVSALGGFEHCLVVRRSDGTTRRVPATQLDALVGRVGQRAKSVAVGAVVGLLQFLDDRSLVVVTDGSQHSTVDESGPAVFHVISRTAFLPMRARVTSVDPQGAQDPETALGVKQRAVLKEFLETGDFIFATDSPATLNLQQRVALRRRGANPADLSSADERFFWNRTALQPLTEAGPGPWLTPIMQGAVLSERIRLPSGGTLLLSLISRRSCEHAGTRLKARGINDDGACANFVESEQILCLSLQSGQWVASSLVQARGSAPVFWEQRGKQLTPKPRVTREVELTVRALRQHIDRLALLYGPPMLLRLLDQKGDEAELAAAFANCVQLLSTDDLGPTSARFCAWTDS